MDSAIHLLNNWGQDINPTEHISKDPISKHLFEVKRNKRTIGPNRDPCGPTLVNDHRPRANYHTNRISDAFEPARFFETFSGIVHLYTVCAKLM